MTALTGNQDTNVMITLNYTELLNPVPDKSSQPFTSYCYCNKTAVTVILNKNNEAYKMLHYIKSINNHYYVSINNYYCNYCTAFTQKILTWNIFKEQYFLISPCSLQRLYYIV